MTTPNRVSGGSVDGASSRVQILGAPILNPGDCVMCGASSSDDRDYIDIGLTVDFIGVIYFCTLCMREVANRLECLMPEQTKALEDELDAARQRILEFEVKDQAFNDAITAIRDLGLLSIVDDSVSPSVDESEGKSSTDGQRPQDIVPDKPNSTGTSRKSNKSTTKQGPDDLSGSSSDDELLGLI